MGTTASPEGTAAWTKRGAGCLEAVVASIFAMPVCAADLRLPPRPSPVRRERTRPTSSAVSGAMMGASSAMR